MKWKMMDWFDVIAICTFITAAFMLVHIYICHNERGD